MTQNTTFPELALLTLKDPASAAEIVMGWQLSKEAIWTSIALVSVIATILATLSDMMVPVPPPLDAFMSNPLVYLLIAAGGFVATVHALYWTGRMMGGRGAVEDLMALLIWLQALRAAGQVAVLVCLAIAPVLASFLVLFIAVATLWVFLNFISIGLKLNSLLRAFVVLFVGAAALMIGVSFFLSLIGVSAVGVPANV
ncbi:MAG: YIP1 family protein [Pseudomonadota bacterium]